MGRGAWEVGQEGGYQAGGLEETASVTSGSLILFNRSRSETDRTVTSKDCENGI
jgi:hypothetical protein